MLDLPRAMVQSLQYPQRLHAALVHLPIGAAVFGLLLLILLAVGRGRNGGLRWGAVAVYLAGVAIAVWTQDAGQDAAGVIVTAGIQRTQEARALLEKHEEMGEGVWMVLLATAALTAATTLRWKAIRLATMVCALAGGITAGAWVGITGYYGGEMVYGEGLGVPTSPNNLPLSRALPAEDSELPGPAAPQPASRAASNPPATERSDFVP